MIAHRVYSTTSLALALLTLALAGASEARVAQGGPFRAFFSGGIAPKLLPRDHPAPVTLRVAARIQRISDQPPPRLMRLRVEVNRHAVISTRGLPICPLRRLRSTTSRAALRLCRRALLGSGRFRAHVDLPEQSPFPARGHVLVFNSRYRGHPALVGHVYGRTPVPTSHTLPILLSRSGRGAFGPVLSVRMPEAGTDWGYVTGLSLELGRRYRFRGRARSFVSASCPVPPGFTSAPFTAARGTYFLAGGRVAVRTLSSICHTRR